LLDPKPWVHHYDSTDRSVSDDLPGSLRDFAPRPGYSQNRDDYRPGGNPNPVIASFSVSSERVELELGYRYTDAAETFPEDRRVYVNIHKDGTLRVDERFMEAVIKEDRF